MKQTLERIHALQELTQQIEQCRTDSKMLSRDMRNQERLLEEKRQRSEQAHEQRMEAAAAADSKELQIEEAEKEIERLKVQLNTARSQRELDAVQHSIKSRVADIQKWEDEALQKLQKADELATEEERLGQEVEEAEQKLEQLRKQVGDQKAELERQAERLREKRSELRGEINPDVLSAYDRLRGHHNGQPLAEVKHRVCQGCFTRITKQSENLLMRGEEIVYCHSCGRMLKLPD